MQQYQTSGVTLPVDPQRVDGSCFNNGLPQNNDIWPQVQFIQGADVQVASLAIAMFRTYAQSRAQRSPIHCFAYNLLQMNRFQNQSWQGWCQMVVDFADLLHRGQSNPPQQAADKAAAHIYKCMLAAVAQQYVPVRNMLDQATQGQLDDAARLSVNISNDITAWRQRGGMIQPNQNFGTSHTQHVNAYAVQPHSGGSASPSVIQGSTGSGDSGLLLGADNPPAVSKPTSSWQGGGNVNSVIEQAPVQGMASNPPVGAPAAGDQGNAIREHNHKAPSTVDEVVIDPHYYQPQGFVPVEGRPYDVIRNPGGVEIRPAYQVLASSEAAKWKRTVGQDRPYASLYDPRTHICFLAKWADGVVKEVVVPITPEMDYLKHEINDTLRRLAKRPEGINVSSPKYTVPSDTAVVNSLEVARQAIKDGEVKDASNAVFIESYITGTTNLENETMARRELRNSLELGPDDPTPPHMYVTANMHELEISEKCFNALFAFEQYTTPQQVIDGLKALLESGDLPVRYFNFIDERLTRHTNDFLRDSLSLSGIKISSYFSDAVDLGPYLAKKRGNAYQTLYHGNTTSIVLRAMSVANEESVDEETNVGTPCYGVIDEFLNFQLGVYSDELTNLDLADGPCLITTKAHPMVMAAMAAMINRARALNILNRATMRLISSDGVYYTVIVGKLVEKALLLKRS